MYQMGKPLIKLKLVMLGKKNYNKPEHVPPIKRELSFPIIKIKNDLNKQD